MTSQLKHTADGRRIHTCSVCGVRDVWSDKWRWYGSIADQDTRFSDELFKTCSDKCANKAVAEKLMGAWYNAPLIS